jgi:hypothetical protein
MKDMARGSLLLRLERLGYLTSPKRQGFSCPNTYRNRAIQDVFHDTTPKEAPLTDSMPLSVDVVKIRVSLPGISHS